MRKWDETCDSSYLIILITAAVPPLLNRVLQRALSIRISREVCRPQGIIIHRVSDVHSLLPSTVAHAAVAATAEFNKEKSARKRGDKRSPELEVREIGPIG